MFKAILEILSDLIPNKDLPNSVWLSRYVLLVSSGLLVLFIFFNSLQNTQLGRNYGITKLDRKSSLTHVGFTYLIRNTRAELREFIGNESAAKVVLVIANYDAKSGFFTLIPAPKDKYLIWEFAAPQDLYLSVTNLERYFRGAEESLSKFKTNSCKAERLPEETITTLIETANINEIDSWVRCPIFLHDDEKFEVAHTVVFYNSSQLSNNGNSDKTLTSEVWKLNKSIGNFYTYFNTILDVDE